MRIDCDVHCAVGRAAALEPYLPAHWREFVELTGFAAPSAVNLVYPRWWPVVAQRGAESVEDLQELLAGVEIAILNCYFGVESVTHPDLAIAIATALNRWLQEEWLDRDERLRGSAVIVPEHADAAIAEIERVAADGRFVQIVVPARSRPGYGHRGYWPIWEAAAGHGLALALTFGGVTGAPPTPSSWPGSYYEDYAAATLAYQSQIISLIMQGTFEQIPELRVAVLESGWTWAPALMWRMDQWWKALQREVPWVVSPPSAHVRRSFRFGALPFDAPAGSSALRHAYEHLGGAGMLMYGSDHPHDYGTTDADLSEIVPAEELPALLWGTAAEFYRLRVPA